MVRRAGSLRLRSFKPKEDVYLTYSIKNDEGRDRYTS